MAVHAFLAGDLSFMGIPRVIESTLSELPVTGAPFLRPSADAQAREVARGGGVTFLSFVLAFIDLAMLVILHDSGASRPRRRVGMRVEKFSLFFPPTLWSKKVGETEYAIGSIPAGGYGQIRG